MKKIIFLENAGDYKSALAYLDRHKDALEEHIVVNLNSDLDFDYPGYEGLVHKNEADYFDGKVFEGINKEGFRYASRWFGLKEAEPLLTYEGVNMGFVMEHFFTRAVITSLKYLRLLKKIITEEGCSEVILVKHNADTAEIKDIVPQSWDKVTNDIIHCLKGELDIRVTEIENLSPKEKAKREPIVDLKDIVCLLVSPLRHLFNFFVNFRDKGKKRVAMVGAPRLIFPILDEVKRRGLYDTVYFQKRLAPRMVFDMLKRGIPYRIESDYRVRNERKVLSDHKSKLEENRRLLLENSQVEEFFSFEGINFFPAIKGRIDYAFRKFMPGMLEEVIRFKRFIKDEKLDFLVIDEDLKQFARPLILCMNQAGVKSLELLHGLYGYFHTSSLVTTKKAVWGNCLKRYFASAGRIPVDALVPTGCPILDVLPKRDKHGDSLRVRKDFGIGEKTRIVLFPSRPFKRGAKGGMVGIHIDRIKYENMLVSVIRTLKDLDGVHLIVKMHHNDSSGDYNRNIIMREGYDKPFTVVQDYNMYSLLNAADLLVTPASTTTVEAIVLDMPVILLNYRREDSLYPFEKWGAVKGVYDHVDLKGAIKEMLSGYNAEHFKEGRRKVLEDLVEGADGKATSRIVSIIDGLIGMGGVTV